MLRIASAFVICLWSAAVEAQEVSDADRVADALWLETLRANPTLAANDETISYAMRRIPELAIANDVTAEQLAAARDRASAWLAARATEPSALPLDATVTLISSIRRSEGGGFLLAAGNVQNRGPISGTFQELTIRGPLQSPAVILHPILNHDLGAMQPNGAGAARLEELAATRQGAMAVATLTISEVESTRTGTATAGGQVTSIVLHELTAPERNQYAPGDPIWIVPLLGDVPAISRDDIARAFRLETVENGDFVDRFDYHQPSLARALAWKELTAQPLETVLDRRLSPDLFWFALTEIAPDRLQDSLIPPHKLTPSRNQFAAEVDVLERQELEDAAITALWPQIAAVLPEEPLPLTVVESVSIRDYDTERGGFAVAWGAGGWLLGTQYPVLAGLPEFLTVPRDQAQVVLQRMDQLDGPGRRALSVKARLDLSVRRATFTEDGPMTQPRLTFGFGLKEASLHVGRSHPDLASLAANKVMDLDPATYRGPAEPLADEGDLARFAALADVPYPTGEAMIAAAIAVADDPAAFAAAMNRQARVSDPLGAAQALPLPDPLIVTGVVEFDRQGENWTLSDVRLGQRSNESGLTAPQVRLANRSVFDALALDPSQSEALQAVRGRVRFHATASAKEAGLEGSRPVVFLDFSDITLFSFETDHTGLPTFRAELDGVPATSIAITPEAGASQAAGMEVPDLLVLDHDLLDLLHLREAPDTVDDPTLDRMLLDRLHRELRTPEADLVWGRFFDPQPQRLNRVERAALWPAFRAWQSARAAALPDRVVARVATNPIQAGCGVMSYADRSQTNQFSPGIAAQLEGFDYETVRAANGADIGMLERMLRDTPERAPLLAQVRLTQMGGRPIYALYRMALHPTASKCTGQEQFDAVTDGFEPAESAFVDAVVVLRDAVLVPQERRGVVETRHITEIAEVSFEPTSNGGAASATAPRLAGTLVLSLQVTDSVFFGADALPSRHAPNPTGQPVRMSVDQIRALAVSPPEAADISGLSLNSSQAEFEAAITAVGAGQRTVTQTFNRVIGPVNLPGRGEVFGTEAGTDAILRVDLQGSEILAAIIDQRLDQERFALGRVTLYDPSQVTPDGVQAALLNKYGDPDFVTDARRGGAGLRRLVWGWSPVVSREECLPRLDLPAGRVLSDAFAVRSDEDRAVNTLSQRLPWPVFEPLADDALAADYATCGTVVIAEVSSAQGSVSLVVWVIDPASLATFDITKPEPKTLGDTRENPADINL
ncbi:hypothetical protein [Paracoccus sp. R86501]|uniref:hypothetical protein n=1 Tax=Paracoccus sp. R86501 TaxID=3101711 RepID=UPI003670D6B8